MTEFLFISGASGSGKTTLTHRLEQKLGTSATFIHTDEYGIPSPEEMVRRYGGGQGFQRHILSYWLKFLEKSENSPDLTIIEGSFWPSILVECCQQFRIKHYQVVLLDCTDETRKKRLQMRGQPELASVDMMEYANILRDEAKEYAVYTTIDTTSMTIDDVVSSLLLHID